MENILLIILYYYVYCQRKMQGVTLPKLPLLYIKYNIYSYIICDFFIIFIINILF